MKRYAIVVVEKAELDYAAYVPDLREAIELHVRGLRKDGLPVPEPSSVVDYLEIPA